MVYIKNQEHEASEPAQGVRKGFIGKEMLRLMLDESLWGDELWELHRVKRAVQTRCIKGQCLLKRPTAILYSWNKQRSNER